MDFGEAEGNPLAEGLDADAILKFRFYWNVSMRGDVVEGESNMNSLDENGMAVFVGKPGDERDSFVVVSRQKKPTGLFGSCSSSALADQNADNLQ